MLRSNYGFLATNEKQNQNGHMIGCKQVLLDVVNVKHLATNYYI